MVVLLDALHPSTDLYSSILNIHAKRKTKQPRDNIFDGYDDALVYTDPCPAACTEQSPDQTAPDGQVSV
jgi:hypothetical protein